MVGRWVEAWLLSKEPPLRDVGELYRERRIENRFTATLWLLGQGIDLVRQLPRLRTARRGDGLRAQRERTGQGWIMDRRGGTGNG